jgi:predicted DNA-binding protein (MmcQ/YjbR family)
VTKIQNSVRRVETELRKIAFGLPGAYEDFPWGESVAKVGKKVFVFFGQPNRGGGFAFSVKLPASGADALDLPFTEPTGYGLGKHDWVTVSFSARDRPPVEILKEWILESYASVAPKKLLAELNRSPG